MPRDSLPAKREWVLKRNCSLTPRQTLRAYLLLLALSLTVGTTFALHGAPLVLCFTALEMGAVTAAWLYYSRHALDHERIVLLPDALVIESVCGARRASVRLDPERTRVLLPAFPSELVTLEARGQSVHIGATLPAWRRAGFARELDAALHGVLPGWG
ncbi:DUF2244 domain-containing protein [Zemynaea arenosa]|uniref:DUF2244 domain-containing protein n=1 Tax=Zemynaea arenosa TaxID=2561931 RepID=UPI001431ECA2|nr:DUF2244 domain-containing protein [Massilia arenosa]